MFDFLAGSPGELFVTIRSAEGLLCEGQVPVLIVNPGRINCDP